MPPRLKQLDLQGYKTFATRSQFILGDGISAIVGPNGCGKSNLADAIRWVLGEQSFSLLRGKKTEDMIFAGSELRPRAGMAQATLTFDNGDGWLPIDFAEVTITRRAYRDGLNEYLLNGQRVRLRDVTELLSRCGLAERTYTIIGQGLVDTALSLRPEERRALFEEAAGIGAYRDKREDALRRLEQTGHNLERVQDILAEIRPRLRALERQAARARDYIQVKADLDELLKVWYGYHWHETQRALDEAGRIAVTRAAELAALLGQQETNDADVIQLRAQISALRAQLNALGGERGRLRAERETLARDLAVAEERVRSLAAQREEAFAELGPLESELAEAGRRVEAARGDLARLQTEGDDARQQAEAAAQSRQAAVREAERRSLAGREAAARARLQSLATQLSERSLRHEQMDRRREQLGSARAEAGFGVAQAEAEVAELRRTLDTRAEAQARLRAGREAIENELAALTEAMAADEARMSEMIAKIADARTDEERLAARREALEQARADLSTFASGAKTLLAAASDGRWHGHRGAAADVLGVPPEYEVAIAAALGTLLDAVIVDGLPAAEAALALLEAEGGRAVLLPLGRLAPAEPLTLPSDPDIVGVAAGLIDCDAGLRPAADVLLGRAIIVRTREAARRWQRSLPSDTRLVTLSGEVYSPSGTIVGGRDAGPTALARAREWRDLSTRRGQAMRERERLGSERRALDDEARRMREARGLLAARLVESQAAEREAVAAHNAAALEFERAAHEAAWRRNQLAALEAETSDLEHGGGALAAELAALAEAHAAAEAEAEAASRQIAEGAASERDLSERLAALKTAAAVAERAVKDATTRVAEAERAHATAETLAKVRRFRVETLEVNAATVAASVANRRERAATLEAESTAAETESARLAKQLADREAEQERVESGEGVARAALHAAERQHADAQLALARSREEVEALRRRIEEDFGLVELDYSEAVTGQTPLPLGELVAKLSEVTALPDGLEDAIQRRRAQVRRIGAINPEAPAEFTEVKQRNEFLTAQVCDLETAAAQLREVIAEMDLLMEREFRKTFEAVAAEFRDTFTALFGGGTAKLVLTDPEHLTTTGIDILARLPGRRPQSLALLSGGERALTACALIFALLRVSPTPFCVLDEVDAMLDEANVDRFREMLVELAAQTQFIVITHNRSTVQAADTVYGISMGADSASQVVSLKLEGEKIAA